VSAQQYNLALDVCSLRLAGSDISLTALSTSDDSRNTLQRILYLGFLTAWILLCLTLTTQVPGKGFRSTMAQHSFYKYIPSKAVAIIACLLFVVITIFHCWQMFRTRTWFFISFVIGGLCMCSATLYPPLWVHTNTVRQSKLSDTPPEGSPQVNTPTTP
jgi:lysylphosphatidylglycerol synthetase-like protein (DUF2156 family)